MLKQTIILLLLLMLVAMPATALAQHNWDGGGVDKYNQGPGTVWDDPVNWAQDRLPTNEWVTEYAAVDEGAMPVITDGMTYDWDRCRIKNGSIITQTGGTQRWRNWTAGYGLAIFNYNWVGEEPDPCKLDMTGGSHYAERVILGSSNAWVGDPLDIRGIGIINIWGNSTFVVEPNTYDDPTWEYYQVYDLEIMDGGSVIDIRDDGVLRVPAPLQSKIDDYITAGKIVAGTPGDSLYNVIIGDEYVIYASDQPPIPGDANRDLQVDDTDATILASNWLGTNKGWGEGDFNYDGVVDEEDASMLAANMGVGVPAAASVPEPGTLLLLCLGLGSLALIRRR